MAQAGQHGLASIAQLTKQTRSKFAQTLDALRSTTQNSPQASSGTADVLNDALQRFQLWAGNIGAAVNAQKRISLEFRLKEAPDVKEQIRRLLRDLIEALDDLQAIIAGQRENRNQDAELIEFDIGDGGEAVSLYTQPIDECQNILSLIADSIGSLLRLSILIRKSTPRNRWSRALQKTNHPFDDQFDIRHVGEKFPKLDRTENEWLKIRLGRAITQRRQFIRYCRDHHQQLREELDESLAITDQDDKQMLEAEVDKLKNVHAERSGFPAPEPTRGSTKASTFQTARLKATQLEVEDDSYSRESTVVSSMNPEDEDNAELLRLPTLQDVSHGKEEFECPFCCMIQNTRRQKKWKRHAFADLNPYLCCAAKGECEMLMFSDRTTWFDHELQQHRHQWSCFMCQDVTFSSLDRFRSHVKSRHTNISEEQTVDFARAAQQPMKLIPAADCPFCDEFDQKLRAAQPKSSAGPTETDVIVVDMRIFRRHVASHLEQLALFSIGAQQHQLPESKSVALDANALKERFDAIKYHLSHNISTDTADNSTLFDKVRTSFSEALSRLRNKGSPSHDGRDVQLETMLGALSRYNRYKDVAHLVIPDSPLYRRMQLAFQDIGPLLEQCEHFANTYLQGSVVSTNNQELHSSAEFQDDWAVAELDGLLSLMRQMLDTLQDSIADATSLQETAVLTDRNEAEPIHDSFDKEPVQGKTSSSFSVERDQSERNIIRLLPETRSDLDLQPEKSECQDELATFPGGAGASVPSPGSQQTFKWIRGQLIGNCILGQMYIGLNVDTGDFIAVKQAVINPNAADQNEEKITAILRSFYHEIDTIQNLKHVNVVAYLGCERSQETMSLFFEYVPGGSIGSLLRQYGKFQEPLVSSITRQTLQGLAYLHGEGVLHRDLKGDNILLTRDGTAKISEFGVSKKTDNIYHDDTANRMQGSVYWVAPEVIRSSERGYSGKVDIWSLGGFVLEMFSGRRPWGQEEMVSVLYKLGNLNQPPPIPDDIAQEATPQALSFMFDCFTIDPEQRPTAQRLLDQPFCFRDPEYKFSDTNLWAQMMQKQGNYGK